MKYIAPQDQTILEALNCMFPESSNTTLRSWLKEGRITVDYQIVKQANFQLRKGQQVSLGARSKFIDEQLKVYFEDRYLVIIEKPEGLLSVATAFEKGDTAHAILKKHYLPERVFVVHRLDQDTSGVMLFALTEEARDLLKATFEKHDITRSYVAIVEGQLAEEEGTWRSYIYEDPNYKMHTTHDPDKGELAISHFKKLASSKRYTALEVTLETGKKNQIRLHCREAGHPVVGDKKYGAVTDPVRRVCLHAHVLAFMHPITRKKIFVESPIPDIFYSLVPKL